MVCTAEYFQRVYDIIKDWPIFKDALYKLKTNGPQVAIDFLYSRSQDIYQFCQRHKNVIAPSTALPARVITKKAASTLGAKTAARCGAKASSRGVKALTKVGKVLNPATLAVDVVQTGLEITGHKEAGMTVGFFGNVGVGAVTGFVTGGPVGAVVGAALCLGSWAVGEAVGAAVDKTLS